MAEQTPKFPGDVIMVNNKTCLKCMAIFLFATNPTTTFLTNYGFVVLLHRQTFFFKFAPKLYTLSSFVIRFIPRSRNGFGTLFRPWSLVIVALHCGPVTDCAVVLKSVWSCFVAAKFL